MGFGLCQCALTAAKPDFEKNMRRRGGVEGAMGRRRLICRQAETRQRLIKKALLPGPQGVDSRPTIKLIRLWFAKRFDQHRASTIESPPQVIDQIRLLPRKIIQCRVRDTAKMSVCRGWRVNGSVEAQMLPDAAW